MTESILKEAIPIYKKEVFSFIRNEKEGNVSVRLRTLPRLQELFFNETSFEILNLCDGKRNCEDILEIFCKTHSGVSKNVLSVDFIRIIKLMSKLQIISWKARNPFMSQLKVKLGDLSFELLDDTNIREIVKFLHNNEKDLQWMNLMHDYKNYNELYIREMLFNYAEDFFGLRRNDGKIIGMVSIKYSVNIKSSVSHIGILICKDENMARLIKGITKFSGKEPLNTKISKIKVQMLSDESSKYKMFTDILKENGFVLEEKSLKEFKGMDLLNYSYYHKV